MLKHLHHKLVFLRRVKVLSKLLGSFISADTKMILDIGSGDGSIGKLMQDNNHAIQVLGIDILARPHSLIPFKIYDGKNIPYHVNSFETVMLIDVLHHLPHIEALIIEAKRVSKKYILIKDHLYKSKFDFETLKFMDDFGNKHHGVARTYNYLKEKEWQALYKDMGLVLIKTCTKIPLYPFPFNMVFGRKLHFISLLEIKNK